MSRPPLKMIIMLGVMFVLGVQPIMMIMMLIMIILMYSLYLYWVSGSFWFSYMLILVMMSGVLVVFTYMMSVLPNESFEVSSLAMVVFGMIYMYKSEIYEDFIQDVSLGSMKIWMGMTLVGSLFLVFYLLFIMIMVIWVSMMEQGAVRIS